MNFQNWKNNIPIHDTRLPYTDNLEALNFWTLTYGWTEKKHSNSYWLLLRTSDNFICAGFFGFGVVTCEKTHVKSAHTLPTQGLVEVTDISVIMFTLQPLSCNIRRGDGVLKWKCSYPRFFDDISELCQHRECN